MPMNSKMMLLKRTTCVIIPKLLRFKHKHALMYSNLDEHFSEINVYDFYIYCFRIPRASKTVS